MIEESRQQAESTRTEMQNRINDLNKHSEEALESIARITAERDALLASAGGDDAPLQEHMESLTDHFTDMFMLYANHESLHTAAAARPFSSMGTRI